MIQYLSDPKQHLPGSNKHVRQRIKVPDFMSWRPMTEVLSDVSRTFVTDKG
jgi:hypothetical protein